MALYIMCVHICIFMYIYVHICIEIYLDSIHYIARLINELFSDVPDIDDMNMLACHFMK